MHSIYNKFYNLRSTYYKVAAAVFDDLWNLLQNLTSSSETRAKTNAHTSAAS